MEPAIAAVATALGGESALIRLSGSRARVIAERIGLQIPEDWRIAEQRWRLAGGTCPCRLLFAPADRSFTGFDLVEITLPGNRDLAEMALQALMSNGATAAGPGAFTRQALANGRLSLDQAEAILLLSNAPSAAAATRALERLRGALAQDISRVREQILHSRALVEAGLDFVEEDGISAFSPAALRKQLTELRAVVARWLVAGDSLGLDPVVVLVGSANAGKSALFNRLTGASALVSPIAGTTRDWLEGTWNVAGRAVRLIDTAGWLDHVTGLDRSAIQSGRATLPGSALVLACSAPDARLPEKAELPAERTLIVATKCDLGSLDPRASLAVSSLRGSGLDELARLVAQRLEDSSGGEPRQQRLLAQAESVLSRLSTDLPADVLLAEDLRHVADALGELIGATTPDDVLEQIFSRFCIGK